MSEPARYRIVDLFAGAGGLTEGFVQASRRFTPVLAVESDDAAAKTYEARFGPHVQHSPIESVSAFTSAEVLVGGPPCQGFSPLGRNGSRDHRSRLNGLWEHYARALAAVEPQVFVLENVPQFLKSDQYELLVAHVTAGDAGGYSVDAFLLNAADFGVPQNRRRAFVIGARSGRPRSPQPTHGKGSLLAMPQLTVADAIADIPAETDVGHRLHYGRKPTPTSLKRYAAIPEGGNRFNLPKKLQPPCWLNKPSGTTDVFGRLKWNEPSCTIRTEFYKPEKGRYLHPTAHRPITHWEAARLQGFPDDYPWHGSKTQIARLIGNAVPPPLARAVATEVLRLLAEA